MCNTKLMFKKSRANERVKFFSVCLLILASFLCMDELGEHMYYAVNSTLKVQTIKNFSMRKRKCAVAATAAAAIGAFFFYKKRKQKGRFLQFKHVEIESRCAR